MRWMLIISIIICLSENSHAQRKGWRIYFSENVDSLYAVSHFKMSRTDSCRRPLFKDYPKFYQTVHEEGNDEQINRLGLLLPAKSTRTFYYTVNAVYGNEMDSVRIWYQLMEGFVRKGRSALISLLNLFSKQEDKSPQEEPYYFYTEPLKKGYIEFENEQLLFSGDTLFRGANSITLGRVQKIIKLKTGKIKKVNRSVAGYQFMKGDSCMAVIDYNTEPITLYFLKSLSHKDRLIYTAFLTINKLSFIHEEEE